MSTVLIVDDHPGFRQAARALLEADGFRVIGESATGTEGLADAHRLRPDLDESAHAALQSVALRTR